MTEIQRRSFPEVDLGAFNETDVREEIVMRVLLNLGYRKGTSADIIRELSLSYTKSQMGRKNPKQDPELRGRADYVLEVERKVRWVIEAKPPDGISADAVDQAFTYARHPDVRAVLFCICDGREFRVYQTALGPPAPPVLTVDYPDLDSRFGELVALLSPAAIVRNFTPIDDAEGIPIGPGLGSAVRVVNGAYTIETCSPDPGGISGQVIFVSGGTIRRDEAGMISARIELRQPFVLAEETARLAGYGPIEFVTSDDTISVQEARPSRFEGEEYLEILLGASGSVKSHATSTGLAYLCEGKLLGTLEQTMRYEGIPGHQGEMTVAFSGRFDLELR